MYRNRIGSILQFQNFRLILLYFKTTDKTVGCLFKIRQALQVPNLTDFLTEKNESTKRLTTSRFRFRVCNKTSSSTQFRNIGFSAQYFQSSTPFGHIIASITPSCLPSCFLPDKAVICYGRTIGRTWCSKQGESENFGASREDSCRPDLTAAAASPAAKGKSRPLKHRGRTE